MEVHAHTHTAHKKWTHYFWEFLMLFLAVFCGFLAENKREHIVEQHRAKEYAESFILDILFDKDELDRGLRQTRFIVDAIDSLVALSDRININEPVPAEFYYYSRFVTSTFRIDWSRSTIDQLIQSGNLRYFKNKDLVAMVNFYYYIQGIINVQNQMDMVHRDKVLDLRNKILQHRYYALFVPLDATRVVEGRSQYSIDSLSGRSFPLQPGSSSLINEFINHALDRKSRLMPILERYYPIAERTGDSITKEMTEEYYIKQKN